MIVDGSGVISSTDSMVLAFQPRRDPQGEMVWDRTGTIASVQRVGGVKARSTGTIAGPAIRVRKEEVVTEEYTAGFGGQDLLELYPVFLDTYQQIGWFPSGNMRIVMGNTDLDRKE